MRRRLGLLAVLIPFAPGCDRFGRHDPPPAVVQRHEPEQVQLPPTSDRWVPRATLVRGATPERAVLLVHQLASDRSEWAPLVHRLREAPAITTLALDLRGHGESTLGPMGNAVSWTTFGTDASQWAGVVRDVTSAMVYLGQLQATRVVLVGSSIGASACARVASSRPEVEGLVMISPGLNYQGIDAREPFSAFMSGGHPPHRALLLGTAGDPPAAEALPVLARLGVGRVESSLFPNERRHGVSLCNTRSERWDRIESFIRQTLDAPRAAPARNDAGR